MDREVARGPHVHGQRRQHAVDHPQDHCRDRRYSIEHVQKLYAPLGSQAIRDVLCLQAKSEMHGTEVDRLASGDGKIVVLKDQGEIAGTVTVKNKTGKSFTVSLDAQALAAAQRLQARNSAPDRQTIREVVERVSKHNGLEFYFGAIRHSFATCWWSGAAPTIRRATACSWRPSPKISTIVVLVPHLSTRQRHGPADVRRTHPFGASGGSGDIARGPGPSRLTSIRNDHERRESKSPRCSQKAELRCNPHTLSQSKHTYEHASSNMQFRH